MLSLQLVLTKRQHPVRFLAPVPVKAVSYQGPLPELRQGLQVQVVVLREGLVHVLNIV